MRINPDTLEPTYKVIGCELWSDEDGFEMEIAATGVTGICGSGIIEVLGEMFLAGILSSDGVIDGDLAERSERIKADGSTFAYLIRGGEPEIKIIQSDVRAIQLAKGALYAGARLLMDRLGIDKVDRISLAGAFGSHIDPKYAMLLGMIPDCPLDKVSAAGNAAGTGSRVALLNKSARSEIEQLVKQIEKVETAVEPAFQQHFIKAIAIPHGADAFPNLTRIVKLPEGKSTQDKKEKNTISRRQQRKLKQAGLKGRGTL